PRATRHVLAAVVAGALDHRDGAGVAYREALAGDAAEVALALDGAVQHGVADDDRVLGDELLRFLGRVDDDAAAGQALRAVVVGLASGLQRRAVRQPGAKALPGRALEPHVDGAVGQAAMAVALGDLARQHGTGGAVGVVDGGGDAHRRAALERTLRLGDELAVEDPVDHVRLRLALADVNPRRPFRLGEQAR